MALSEHRQTLQDLKQPDPFFEAMGDAREYFAKNRSLVIAAGTAVVVLLTSVVGVGRYYQSQSERAATDFSAAVSSLEFESPSAAEVALAHVAERSNAGPYVALSELYRGDIAASAGRNDEAIAAFDKFLTAPPTEYAKQIGLMGKAFALENAGKAADAAATLELAAAIKGPYRKAALSDRARLAEEAGDKAAASTNLTLLLEIEGSGPGAADVERRLQALK